jgi:NTP pyrophosphatase (non-canonical NTP hydrolase)
MDIKEITGRNYYANKRRGQIKNGSNYMDFLIKLEEEVNELIESTMEHRRTDNEELADVVLVCFAMAQHFNIDLLKVMEDKMLINEKRKD